MLILGDCMKIVVWRGGFSGARNEHFFADGWDSPPMYRVSLKGSREGQGSS